jgi:hypothetical protein
LNHRVSTTFLWQLLVHPVCHRHLLMDSWAHWRHNRRHHSRGSHWHRSRGSHGHHSRGSHWHHSRGSHWHLTRRWHHGATLRKHFSGHNLVGLSKSSSILVHSGVPVQLWATFYLNSFTWGRLSTGFTFSIKAVAAYDCHNYGSCNTSHNYTCGLISLIVLSNAFCVCRQALLGSCVAIVMVRVGVHVSVGHV